MEKNISIDSTSCIKCGRCARVCPTVILTQSNATAPIEVQNVSSCIVCGHCVACCPTNSVIHSEFPAEKVHKIDYAQMPTPEQIMLLCKVRRSNRAFSTKAISNESLDMILDAAHRAPTGSNAQQVAFTLITDPNKLNMITDYTLGVYESVVKKLENPLLRPLLKSIMPSVYAYIPNFKRLINERKNGNDLILRGATAVLLIHTPQESRLGSVDANLAYQNGSLMAESLGISQFYTGFVLMAIKQDKGDRLSKLLGIKGKIHAGMALGVSSFRFPNYIDKKDMVVEKM